MSGVVMLVVGISYAFGWVIAKEQIPMKLANFMINIPGGKWAFLLSVNVLLLAMGMFFGSDSVSSGRQAGHPSRTLRHLRGDEPRDWIYDTPFWAFVVHSFQYR